MLMLLLMALFAGQDVSAERARADCGDWRDCHRLALEAASQHDYEAFHDLAWRAVQKAPAQDTSLMYMLARAQSLSGRPDDALVMLLRLAERGVITDAPVNEDFAPVRRLAQWGEAEARLRGAPAPADASGERASAALTPAPPTGAGGRGEVPTGTETSAATTPSSTAALLPKSSGSVTAEDALRVPALAMTPIALAHDRASGRFVFGDAAGRKLVIVDERMHFVVDLVREASGGFYDIAAFEIDARRGDLWIVSADPASHATALHHIQLVSGRPLERLDLPAGTSPGRFVDVAVTDDGTVYVLDAEGSRLFSLPQKARALRVAARLDLHAPSSLAPAGDGLVYVAHERGVSRVDIATGRVLALDSRAGALPAFARIRWHAGALVGVERLDDGTCRIMRVAIDARSGRARSPQVLTSGVSIPAPSAISVSDDALYYVTREDGSSNGGVGQTIVKRIRLGEARGLTQPPGGG